MSPPPPVLRSHSNVAPFGEPLTDAHQARMQAWLIDGIPHSRALDLRTLYEVLADSARTTQSKTELRLLKMILPPSNKRRA